MKKIVAYVGCNKKKSDSNLIHYIDKIIIALRKEFEIDFILYTPNNFPLHMCRGCNNCFTSHQCPLDKLDSMEKIKKDFLESDFIILGSPVYMHNVSGGMKNFLDRIAYWSHIFALRGKNAMVIVSASSNGTSLVSGYLERMLHFFGSPVVAKINLLGLKGFDDDMFEQYIVSISNSLKIPILSNDAVEKNFSMLKIVMKNISKLDAKNIELMYWEKYNLLTVDKLSQIVEDEAKRYLTISAD